MKYYRHDTGDKACSNCDNILIEEYWENLELSISRTGLHCPVCRMREFKMIIEPDDIWLPKVRHVLDSEEKKFIRTIEEDEIIKIRGVYAWWFPIGRTIYLEPKDTTPFLQKLRRKHAEKILVYLPNNYLQRLYFMVPKDAIA